MFKPAFKSIIGVMETLDRRSCAPGGFSQVWLVGFAFIGRILRNWGEDAET